MYKLWNWILSFLLFNAFWGITVLTLGVVVPKMGVLPELEWLMQVWWLPYTLICWVGLQFIMPFDAIGFVKKVEAAFEEAIGLEKEVVPEVRIELELQEVGQEQEKQKADPA